MIKDLFIRLGLATGILSVITIEPRPPVQSDAEFQALFDSLPTIPTIKLAGISNIDRRIAAIKSR